MKHTALWDMWEYLYRKSKVNVSKEKVKQHFIKRLSKQNHVSGRCLKIIYVTSRCEIYLLQITYWFACKGNDTSDLKQHYCVSLSRNVKSIDVKGYFPERNSYQQCNIEPDIERNKSIYYPTALRRVQKTLKTSTNITRYLYSRGPVRQVCCH